MFQLCIVQNEKEHSKDQTVLFETETIPDASLCRFFLDFLSQFQID